MIESRFQYVPEMATTAPQLFDVTARKVHQWSMVALIVLGFLLGDHAGWLPVGLAGVVMLAGRFWWPADVFRQLTWRVLEPRGLLRRREVHEDHATRRIARVMGGGVWLVAAALLLLQTATVVAWVLALAIAAMVVLDAAADFCALCFLFLHLGMKRSNAS
jgi:hypothetical protein